MVLAILAGRKTQTRRVVKGSPAHCFPMLGKDNRPDGTFFISRPDSDRVGSSGQRCPYGAPGDRLWVREAWRIAAWRDRDNGPNDRRVALDYRASPELIATPWLRPPPAQFRRLVRQSGADCRKAIRNADDGDSGVEEDHRGGWTWSRGASPCRWRSPRFMPRWASRLTLEVTEVRVQRLQEISEADARAEGVEQVEIMLQGGRTGLRWKDYEDALALATPLQSFLSLWNSVNGRRDGARWAENPWVWAISFKRVEATDARR